MSQRKQFGGEFKARIALEALKEQKTTVEIASEYGVHLVKSNILHYT